MCGGKKKKKNSDSDESRTNNNAWSKKYKPSFDTDNSNLPSTSTTKLNKLKTFSSALDEEKRTKDNEEYKKLMTVRANMLLERRNELLRLLDEDTVSKTCKSLTENGNETYSIPDRISFDSPVHSVSSSEEKIISKLHPVSSQLCCSSSFQNLVSEIGVAKTTVEPLSVVEKTDFPTSQCDTVVSSVPIIEETNTQLSQNLTSVNFAKGDKRSQNHIYVNFAECDKQSTSSDIVIPRHSSDFMRKMHDFYDKKMIFSKPTASDIEPWMKVRGTAQFPVYSNSPIFVKRKSTPIFEPHAPVLQSFLCLGEHNNRKCIPSNNCRICSSMN